jgi:hypothetical protein
LVGAVVLSATALMGLGVPPAAASTINQSYFCNAGFETFTETNSVTGTARLNATTKVISVNGVVFTFINNTITAFTGNGLKMYVPDPNKTSAPYKTASAKAGTTPPGWTAGHDATGVFALFAGSFSIAPGGKMTNAPLSASYIDKGPKGTKISFKPGRITFKQTSPISGTVSCTPNSPVGIFASVTE